MSKANLKVGDIITVFEKDGYNHQVRPYTCVVLRVTKRMWKEGMNCDKPGLYGFYGRWYGDDPLNVDSYGKIQYIGANYVLMGTVKNNKTKDL